eukprot:1142017-Pelagomonas_calceolata.AAC.2
MSIVLAISHCAGRGHYPAQCHTCIAKSAQQHTQTHVHTQKRAHALTHVHTCVYVQVDEHMQHAVQVEPSSFEEGLDERRLTFRIDTEGNVLDVNATAPTSLFGFCLCFADWAPFAGLWFDAGP